MKRGDFFRANMKNFTFYTEHAGEVYIYASQLINSVGSILASADTVVLNAVHKK